MHTEEEAKEMWCPYYRFWVDGPYDDVDGDTRLDGRIAKAQGYCGLAGKP